MRKKIFAGRSCGSRRESIHAWVQPAFIATPGAGACRCAGDLGALFDMPIPGRLCPNWAESILCCIPIGRWTRGPYGGGFRLAAQRAGRARHRFRLAFDVEDRMRKLPDGQKAQAWNVQIMRVAGGATRQLLADSAAGWRRSSRSAFAASSFPT